MDTCLCCNTNFVFNPFDGDPICDDCYDVINFKLELQTCPCDCGNKEKGIVCYCSDPNRLEDNMYSTVEYHGDDPHKASLMGMTWSQYHVNGMPQEEYYWWIRYHMTCERFQETKRELEWNEGATLSWVQWEHAKNEAMRQDFIDELDGMTFGNDPTEAEYEDRATW